MIKRESKLQPGFYEWEKRVGSERGEPRLAVACGLVRANSRSMHESCCTSRRHNRHNNILILQSCAVNNHRQMAKYRV